MDSHLIFRPDVLVDDGQAGQFRGAAGLANDGVGVGEDLVDGHGVHLTTVVVAGLNSLLEVATGDLGGEVVGDDVAGTALLLDPGEVGQGDPDRVAVDGEADVGGIGVTRGDGDDGSLPGAVLLLSGPAVGHFEVFVHTLNFSAAEGGRPTPTPLLRKFFKTLRLSLD